MSRTFNEYNRFERVQDENIENEQNENDLKTLQNWWLEDLGRTENSEMLINQLEKAKKIAEKEKELDEKLESEEISKDRYDHERLVVLGREKAKFGTKCALESEGITYDHLKDVSEDYEILTTMNPKPAEMKEKMKELIHNKGPEYSKELADKKLEKGEISKTTHESIMAQIRLHKKRK